MAVRRRRPLFRPPRPRRNRYIPSSDRAHSTPQPDSGYAVVRRLRIRFPGLPLRNEAQGLRFGWEIGVADATLIGIRICSFDDF